MVRLADATVQRLRARSDGTVRDRCDGPRGIFEVDDVVGGLPVRLRFEWRADGSTPRWQQSFL
jgi:hypothetical protein